MGVAVWACLAGLVLLLPPAIAWRRDVPDAAAILTTSLLAGWTVVGWAFALIWACMAPSRSQVRAEQAAWQKLSGGIPVPAEPAPALVRPPRTENPYAKSGVIA